MTHNHCNVHLQDIYKKRTNAINNDPHHTNTNKQKITLSKPRKNDSTNTNISPSCVMGRTLCPHNTVLPLLISVDKCLCVRHVPPARVSSTNLAGNNFPARTEKYVDDGVRDYWLTAPLCRPTPHNTSFFSLRTHTNVYSVVCWLTTTKNTTRLQPTTTITTTKPTTSHNKFLFSNPNPKENNVNGATTRSPPSPSPPPSSTPTLPPPLHWL